MCARYTLTLEQARLVIAGLVHIFAFAPRYNIGPAQRVPVILNTAEGVKAVEMRWGIPSAWSKTLHINAQAENIHKTTTFKPLLGYSNLRHSFMSRVGISPREHYLNTRIHKSQDLLVNTAKSVKEIAEILGFESASHFSKQLKNRIKDSPNRWREKLAKHRRQPGI